MSYGGTVTRGRRGRRPANQGGEGVPRSPGVGGGRHEPAAPLQDNGEIDWERIAIFGSGIALGAALGAGVALLFAPFSGEETRAAIRRRGARLATRSHDAWEDLRDELRWAARRGKRRVGRRIQRARWAAEDFVDERQRPDRWRRQKHKAQRKSTAPPPIADSDLEEIVDSMC